MAAAKPKMTLQQVLDWCPEPRGLQPTGTHAPVPAMTGESADGQQIEVNRELGRRIAEVLKELKKNDDPNDPDKGPRFVIQWRMFPNGSNTYVQNGQCGCGCSCGCG
jgi:hypothetical protein